MKIIFFVEKALAYWFHNECLNNNALNYIKNPLGLKVNGNDKTGEMASGVYKNLETIQIRGHLQLFSSPSQFTAESKWY